MADRSDELQSQLYLLRVWLAPGADGAAGWRGKLQPVAGDGSYVFAGAAELLTLLARLLPGDAPGGPAPADPDRPAAQES